MKIQIIIYIILSIILLYFLVIKGLIRYFKSVKFWLQMNKVPNQAYGYFAISEHWMIDYKPIVKKNWYGPYRFNSDQHGIIWVYCKGNDVTKYWDDFQKFCDHYYRRK